MIKIQKLKAVRLPFNNFIKYCLCSRTYIAFIMTKKGSKVDLQSLSLVTKIAQLS